MPELPEVETVRTGLERVLLGHTIRHVHVRCADLRWPVPSDFAAVLRERRIEHISRRGKYIIAEAHKTGTTPIAVLIHLGMSGHVVIAHLPFAPLQKHDHIVIDTVAGVRVVLNDPRRFGSVDWIPVRDINTHPRLQHMGIDALSPAFTGGYLYERCRGKQSALKQVLLDQSVVAGLGNIYVCEALHRAGILPMRAAGRIGRTQMDRCVTAAQGVLRQAIEYGGTTISDHRQISGEIGYFQNYVRVYGRTGKECLKARCTGIVRAIKQNGRSSFYCPKCQR